MLTNPPVPNALAGSFSLIVNFREPSTCQTSVSDAKQNTHLVRGLDGLGHLGQQQVDHAQVAALRGLEDGRHALLVPRQQQTSVLDLIESLCVRIEN